jgi:hypothetical protein
MTGWLMGRVRCPQGPRPPPPLGADPVHVGCLQPCGVRDTPRTEGGRPSNNAADDDNCFRLAQGARRPGKRINTI